VRGRVRHAPPSAGRTTAATLAGEGDDAVEAAAVAVHAHETVGEDATAEEAPKLALDEPGERGVRGPARGRGRSRVPSGPHRRGRSPRGGVARSRAACHVRWRHAHGEPEEHRSPSQQALASSVPSCQALGECVSALHGRKSSPSVHVPSTTAGHDSLSLRHRPRQPGPLAGAGIQSGFSASGDRSASTAASLFSPGSRTPRSQSPTVPRSRPSFSARPA